MTGRLDDVKILIVDDDRDVLESMDAAFQAEGAATQLATDGNEAVRICMDDPPELVVLDMMLPRRSGFLALERIKGREDSPLVIMVTANEGRRHQAYAESLGVDAYLQKPVPLQRLVTLAADLIDKRDLEEGGDDEGGDGDEGEGGGGGGGGGGEPAPSKAKGKK